MRFVLLSVAILLSGLTAAAQTDVGSVASAGATTADVAGVPRTPQGLLQALKDEVAQYQAWLKTNKRPELTDDECQAMIDGYKNLQKQHHNIIPFEYLSRAIVILRTGDGALNDKTAELIRSVLKPEAASRGGQFSALIANEENKPTLAPAQQFKQNLKATKSELDSATK